MSRSNLSAKSILKSTSKSKQPLQQVLRIDGHMQNIYLAVYADKLLLLDGCSRADVGLILDTIRNILGRKVTDLKVVIVTHMHADHAGGASFLRKVCGCKIISAEQSKQWYQGGLGALCYLTDLSLAYFVAYRQGKFANLNYPRFLYPDIVVNDGDKVPMFEDWQIITTEGHTDRDLSVYHPQTGKIYVADLVIRLRDNKYVNPFNVHDPKAYVKSLKKVKKLQPRLVMMAHGGQDRLSNQTFDKLIKMTPHEPRFYKALITEFILSKK